MFVTGDVLSHWSLPGTWRVTTPQAQKCIFHCLYGYVAGFCFRVVAVLNPDWCDGSFSVGHPHAPPAPTHTHTLHWQLVTFIPPLWMWGDVWSLNHRYSQSCCIRMRVPICSIFQQDAFTQMSPKSFRNLLKSEVLLFERDSTVSTSMRGPTKGDHSLQLQLCHHTDALWQEERWNGLIWAEKPKHVQPKQSSSWLGRWVLVKGVRQTHVHYSHNRLWVPLVTDCP